jgi:hypothetical protein
MLLTDLRLALRLLLVRRPLFSALATATLAIGIAANAVIQLDRRTAPQSAPRRRRPAPFWPWSRSSLVARQHQVFVS